VVLIIGYWLARCRADAAVDSPQPAGTPVLATSFAEPDSAPRMN
jgi:hypothetical protein